MSKTRVSGTFNIERVMLGKPDDIITSIRFVHQGSATFERIRGLGSFLLGLILSFEGAITCPNHMCSGTWAIQSKLFSVSGHFLKVPSFFEKPMCLADFQKKWASEQSYAGQLFPRTVVQIVKETRFKFQPFKGSHITTKFVMGGPSRGFDMPAYVSCQLCGTVYADCADIQTDFAHLWDEHIRGLSEDLVPPLWEENEEFQVKLPDKEKWLTPAWIEEIQRLEEYQKQSMKKPRRR